MSRKNQKNIEKKKGENAMKKLGIGFVAVFFFAVIAVSANAFAGVRQLEGASSLYDNGFMNEVLTRNNPSPWNVVRHYAGNHPKLIVKILKEQGFDLNPAVKYPVGTAVKIPQKYVLQELLPSPSQAEVVLKDAERQAELQKQTNDFLALLKSKKSKETALATSYGFIILLVIVLFAVVMASRSWHNKFVGAEATVRVREKELEKDKDFHRQYVASAKNKESYFANQVAVLEKKYGELLEQTPGSYRSVRECSGKEHLCLVVSAHLVGESKATEVSIACPYCSREKVSVCQSDEGMRGHISRNHPEQMNPNPKDKSNPATLTITTEALIISEEPFKK